MSHRVINAQPRAEMTKGELRALRGAGKIPAVVYGGGSEAVQLLLDGAEFQKATTGITESTILTLSLGDKEREVFVKERQRDALSNKIIHVDFLEIEKDRSLHARVPFRLVGTPVGVKSGGILENPAHEIEVECLPRYLPEKIEVDVSNLEVNHSIHVRDIHLAPEVKVLSSSELVVALVKFAKIEVEETAAPAAEAATAEAGAEGAPAAPGAPAAAGAPAAPAEKKEEKK